MTTWRTGSNWTTAAGRGAGVDRPTVRLRHWIPEMVSLAGAIQIGAVGAASRRISWDDVKAAQPDVVVIAACGDGR